MELNCRKNTLTDEVMYSGQHSSGLKIYIFPKKDYSGTYAILGTRFGSVDSEFVVPGESWSTMVPDGIAHFLEHKMFDQPDGSNVFDKFSQYGGNANAFTSFNMTAYLFSATSHFDDNLRTLLDYVQSPYYTRETVWKERGIIEQEIKMYEDDPAWRLFYSFTRCLYNDHPVRKRIAGTEDSISWINEDYLYLCYKTFYNLSNMALVIAGNVDVDNTVKVIEESIKNNEPFTEPIKRIYPDEPKRTAAYYSESYMPVATPMFMFGYKDNDVNLKGRDLLKKNIEITILLRMLFSKSSMLYKKLYDMDLINSTFSVDYTMNVDYGFTTFQGETKDPAKLYKTLLNNIDALNKDQFNEDDFERAKKVLWGQYIRSYNDIEDFSCTFIQMLFMDIDYFDYYDVYKTVTFDDIKRRFEEHFKREAAVMCVVRSN